MSDWKSIETAPRDGQKYLAYSVINGMFIENKPPNCYPGEWYWNEKRRSWRGHAHADARTATHWTPLPTPPKENP